MREPKLERQEKHSETTGDMFREGVSGFQFLERSLGLRGINVFPLYTSKRML
jgi:hypothetical protein